MPTTLNGNDTTTASTTLNGKNTTTVATTLNSNFTTITADTTALNNNPTTAKTLQETINSTTVTAAVITGFDGNTTSTTAALINNSSTTETTPASRSNSTTPVATTAALNSNSPMTTTTTAASKRRKRAVQQISGNVTQSSNDTTSLFQGMEVNCSIKSEINHTKCTVMLHLSNKIPSCCILQTLCGVSKNSSDIHVVGTRADELKPLQNQCNSHSEEPNSCIYRGPQGASCEESGPTYVIPTDCDTGNCCSCSSYCNKSDAYYTFSISLQDPTMNSSFVSSLISMLALSPNCTTGINVTCPLFAMIASEYRSVRVDCEMMGTNQSCQVILGFAREVPICSVAEAVVDVFRTEENINYDGQVRRAAICGSIEVNASSLNSQFAYRPIDYDSKPNNVCMETEQSNQFTCKNEENVLVNLKEHCDVSVLSTTTSPNATISPNVTTLNATASPNVTTLNTTASPNVTTLNTTASPNVTTLNTTASPNVTTLNTTASPNVTTLNTTASPNVTTLNTTASPNVTTLNTTASPNVTTLNTTTSPNVTTLNGTTSPNVTYLNTTSSPNVTSLNTTSPNVTSLNTTASPNVTNHTNVTTGPNMTVSITEKPTVQPSNNTLTPTTTPKTQENTTHSLTTSAAGGIPSSNTTTTTANGSGSGTSSATNGTAESQARELLARTKDVSNLTTAQIEQLVSQLEKLLSGPSVSKELGNISVNIVSNLLDASAEKLSSSSDRIIGIVDTVGLKLVIKDTAENLLYPSLAVSVKPADGNNFQETVFSILDPSNVLVRGNPRLKRSALKDSSNAQGSITLPSSLTQDLTTEERQLVSRVQFNFYQKSTVFKDDSLGKRRLNSGILGASVANLSIKGLQDSVVIRLRNTEPVPANFVAVCVFWDFTINNGSGGWSSDGCFVKNTTDDETVCGCNHLTSFAILLDLSREPLISRVQATILTFITYIGCGLSAIFLSITLLTYLVFGKLRKDTPSKILIQLCLALLLLNLVFLVDAWLALYPEAVGLCISTAWFLHYFLLVSFTWMGLEGVHMYYALVKVFTDNLSHYMLKFSLVGWGVPMIVVIIVIAIDKDNYGLLSYGRFPDGSSDDFCWIKNDIAFYVAVVAYFCVIFVFNFIMFIVVLVQWHKIKKQNPHNNRHRSTLQNIRSMVGITLLLGLTWGFAFFAWGPLNLPFMYLFAIFNSLQGFFIFIFHCAVKETVRRQWRIYLCCGRLRLPENSEWSRTATQKNTKKSPLTSFTSSQGSHPSSSSFLATPTGELNGIGNPIEDRIITADEQRADVVLNEMNRELRSRRGS
ncbi:uncharacterized protein V3H82_021173 [Fundulus diaphanus]